MKAKYQCLLLVAALSAGVAKADLYYIGSEAVESLPLKWSVGANLIYDDNVTPGAGNKEDGFSINPYAGLAMINLTPQTTIDVYARLGLVYYFDKPSAVGAEDTYLQARAGLNVTHRYSEQLRVVSRNFLAYELEPDYSYGVVNTRQVGEYLYWQTDNAVGYRWTDRFATYTGFNLTQFDYAEAADQDRFTWTLYNQFRYIVGPQTVATFDYRYADTNADGVASDSTSHYLLGGVEHRFSPNTIATLRAGVNIRDVNNGSSETNPHLEFALDSRVNDQFRIRGFARYAVEYYDTVQFLNNGSQVEFDERLTFRLGVKGEYSITPMFTAFAGLDYIPTSFQGGRLIAGPGPASDQDEDLINLYTGVSIKFNDMLYGTLTYNFTSSDADIISRDYDRNRISVGITAEF